MRVLTSAALAALPILLAIAAGTARAELTPAGPEARIAGGDGRSAASAGPNAIGVAAGNGRFMAARSESGIFTFTGADIAATIWGSDGAVIDSELVVNRTSEDEQSSASVCGLNDGSFLVVWQDLSSDESIVVRAQRIGSDGSFAGQEIALDTGSGSPMAPVAGCPLGTGLFVAWNDYDEQDDSSTIKVRLFTTDGEPVFDVGTASGPTPLGRSGPAIANDPQGGLVVTWANVVPYSSGVIFSARARRYSRSGLPQGNAFTVHEGEGTVGLHKDPVAVVNSDGSFTIFWSAEREGTVSSDIVGRRFGSDGTPLGTEVTINQTLEGLQTQPAAAKLASGNVIVVWTTNDADRSGISAREINADLTPVGDEFAVNTTTQGNQDRPGVAANATGEVVMVWSSEGANGPASSDVYAQRYSEQATTCSVPVTSGSSPLATDCLFILQVAVGSQTCTPECICAPSGNLPPTATDALACLQAAVGAVDPSSLSCPCGT